jgi:hypothetical protein
VQAAFDAIASNDLAPLEAQLTEKKLDPIPLGPSPPKKPSAPKGPKASTDQ